MNALDFSITTADYSTAAFNALPEFFESKARFDQKKNVLNRLGEIIRRHGVEKYVGAALIHKHFPLNLGERIVEKVESHGSLLIAEKNLDETELTPYLWHLSQAGTGVDFEWRPVEYVRSSDLPNEVRELAYDLPTRSTLLQELAVALIEAQAQDTFGIALLHRQRIEFDRDHQLLLESPGPIPRSLVVNAVNSSRSAEDDYTQTYWHFDVGGEALAAGCDGHGCAGYCSMHG